MDQSHINSSHALASYGIKIFNLPPTCLIFKFNFSTRIDKILFCFIHSAYSKKVYYSYPPLSFDMLVHLKCSILYLSIVTAIACYFSEEKLYSISTNKNQINLFQSWIQQPYCISLRQELGYKNPATAL